MKTVFRESFWRDVKKIRSKKTRSHVEETIEAVENAASFSEISNVKKMAGHSTAFRIRVSSLRIGFFLEGDTVEFACCLDRKDIYRHFP